MLFESDGEVVVRDLAGFFRSRYGEVKLILVEGNPRALIVKTTNLAAAEIKEASEGFKVGGRRLVPVLTSGAVGNLKRRATEGIANGQVHE